MKRILSYILCLILLAGCNAANSSEPVMEEQAAAAVTVPAPTASSLPDPETAVPQEGGTLRLAIRAPLTLNPLLNEDVTIDRFLKLLFEPLTVLDDTLKPSAHLASLNFASDYTSVNLTLRNDAIWSDGTPVSSDDLIFSIEVLRNAPEGVIYKHNIDNIAAYERVDAKTVKITFVEVFGGSGYLFNFPVIPQHYYQDENDPSSAINMAPLGNGPFMFESYTPMEFITLAKNANSFRTQAYIEQVEALVLPDVQTELDAFDQGLIDVLPMEITEWSKHHSVKQTRGGEYDAQYYEFIGFNFNHEVLRNRLFRESLVRAMDLDNLVPSIYLSHAARAVSPINPGSWLYDGEASAYTYDINLAKSLLSQLRSVNLNTTFRILVNEENDERVKTAEAVKEALQQLGLQAELTIRPFDEFSRLVTEGDFDIFVGGYNLSSIPDLTFAFHSEGIATGSNLFSYENAELDRLLDTAFSSGAESAYQQALSNVQRHIAAELPVISVAFRKAAVLTDTRIYGELHPSADNIFANVEEWFIVSQPS